MRRSAELVTWLLSVGWLVPAGVAGWLLLAWLRSLEERLAGGPGAGVIDSFPYLEAVRRSAAIGFVWLAVAVAYWTWRGLRRR